MLNGKSKRLVAEVSLEGRKQTDNAKYQTRKGNVGAKGLAVEKPLLAGYPRPYHSDTQFSMTLLSVCCSVAVMAAHSFIQLFGQFSCMSVFNAWPKF